MSFADWLTETRLRYREQSTVPATRASFRALARGAVRRTIGPHVGLDPWTREWDVLVLLDACRPDSYAAVAPEFGLPTGTAVWSPASCSPDYIHRVLKAHPDGDRAGYVTANPFSAADAAGGVVDPTLTEGRNVAYLDEVWKHSHQTLPDSDVEVTPPDAVTNAAIWAARRRDRLGTDRLVVHYMQPHIPFRSRPEWTALSNVAQLRGPGARDSESIWDGVARERTADVRAAFRDNLQWVLEDVADRLLPNLSGRVVLSADHGNAFGEWGAWGHPPGELSPGVRKVPWAVVECEDGETVVPDAPTAGTVDPDVEERLEVFGYR